LVDNPNYQAVAKHFPDQTSLLSFQRPEEQAKVLYEAFKKGDIQKALEGAKAAAGPDVAKVDELIDPSKLPDFSVFAKYLSPGGSWAVMDEDGVIWTGFTLKKTAP